jgi:exonuclease III
MAGTSNSGNKHSIPINPETELGEAIESIIFPQGYGTATFFVKEFMEKHRTELIDFWNRQGKDGNAIFEKWFKKWSMKKEEQDTIKVQKEKEAHDKLVKQYMALGISPEQAEEFAFAFPDGNPVEVIRIRTYSMQNGKESKEKVEETKMSPEQTRALRKAEEDLAVVENYVPNEEQLNNPDWKEKHDQLIAERRAVVERLKKQIEVA